MSSHMTPQVAHETITMQRKASLATLLGGTAWILGTLQYVLAQIFVAAAWSTPYSLTGNFISDLGNTSCGPFAVPHGNPVYVCSPQHNLMNGAFVVAGILTLTGAVLLKSWWPSGRAAQTSRYLWIVAGLGKLVVGLVPENTRLGLHLLGALNVPIGSVAILLFAIAIRHDRPGFSAISAALAVVGLAGTFLSTAGEYGGHALLLGLGVGGTERIGAYPGNLWMLLAGLLAVISTTQRRPA